MNQTIFDHPEKLTARAIVRAGQCDVWLVDLAAQKACTQRHLDSLSQNEHLRFRKMAGNPQGAACFLAARGALRSLLAAYLGIEPYAVPIFTQSGGKPALSGNPLYFNLSHSGNLATIAICPDAPLGVDVELCRPMPRLENIAARFFTIQEADHLRATPYPRKTRLFFRYWTLKEAYVKASGKGLKEAFNTFSFNLVDPNTPQIQGPEHDWSLQELHGLQDGQSREYCSSVIVHKSNIKIALI